MHKLITPLALFCCLCLFGCDSGGNDEGSGFVGAAIVRISTSPSTIDTGDRTEVKVDITDVNPNGIILKIRYPEDLSYVLDSAELTIGDDETSLTPALSQSDGDRKYLVFFLPQDSFGKDEAGIVTVQLEAGSDISDERVEVDADVDDPLINNDVEFNIDEPEFAAEDEAAISVDN